jgi:hypothetical protein
MLGKRRTCSHCKKRRKIITFWEDTRVKLCRECALSESVAFFYSIRGGAQR